MNKNRRASNHPFMYKWYLSSILSLIVGALAAAAAGLLIRSWEYKRMVIEFQHLAANQAQAIEESLKEDFRILKSIRALYLSSQIVERGEFHEFTKPFAAMPDIQALGWIPRVSQNDRREYETQARAEGVEGFQFTEYGPAGKPVPAAERSEYFPVYFVEPLPGNEALLGFDMTSIPSRKEALDLARDTASMAATERLPLIQDIPKAFGVIAFLPVYRRGADVDDADDTESRRQNLEGLVFGTIRVEHLVEDALEILDVRGVALKLLDVTDAADQQLLCFYLRNEHAAVDDLDIPRRLQRAKFSVTFQAADRKWAVESVPTAEFAQRYLTFWPGASSAIILLMSVLVAFEFYLGASRTRAIELEVARRTEELRATQTRFRAIFDQTFQFIGLMNPDGVLLEANRTSLEFAGLKESDVLGRPFWETPWWRHSSELREKLKDAVRKAAAGRFVRFELTSYTADGELIDVDFSLKPVFDERGNVCLLIPEGRDITTGKQAAREREELLKILEVKNKELQAIVYVASHDLKSPLVNIQGFSSELEDGCRHVEALLEDEQVPRAIRDRLRPILAENIPESLRFIQKSAVRMGALINGLLRLSRIGTADLSIVPLNMNDLLKSVLTMMEYRIQQNAVSVTLEPLPPCLGDAEQINQVFTNLVDNAIKYLDPRREGILKIFGKVENGCSIYCVQDNGKGIAARHFQKIFELFHRLDPTGPIEGEGLGLTLVSRILDRHAGRIWVESQPDKGSSFYVSLPAAPTKP